MPRKIVSIEVGVFRAIVVSTNVKPGVVSDVIVPAGVITGVDISINFPVELTAFQ